MLPRTVISVLGMDVAGTTEIALTKSVRRAPMKEASALYVFSGKLCISIMKSIVWWPHPFYSNESTEITSHV